MHIIIDFKNDVSTEQIEQYLTANSCTVVKTFNSFDRVYLVSTSVIPPLDGIVESLLNDEDLEIKPVAYPRNNGETFANVEFSSSDSIDWWKMASVNFPNRLSSTQTYQRRGDCAVIYLVDSGVDLTHPEFEFSTVSNLWSFNNDFHDLNSHGTALASLLCGKTCSLADAEVKSVKIWQNDVATRLSDFLGAFDAIKTDIPNINGKLPIVNLSWGITKNSYVEAKIKVLLDAGVVIVAAAGNSGTSIENITPASMTEVFTVGAYNETFAPCDFSNYSGSVPTINSTTNSGELDGWAPGSNIKVAMPGGSYGIASGTSMAAAIHSAAVAFNSHVLQLPNGTFPQIIFTDLAAASISTGKKDYLDLSNVQYRNSKNILTVYYGESDGYNKIVYPKPESLNICFASEKEVQYLLAPSFVFSSMILHDALPSGLTQKGLWITGKVESEELINFETVIDAVNNFGETHSFPLTIKIVPVNRLTEFSVVGQSGQDIYQSITNFTLYDFDDMSKN